MSHTHIHAYIHIHVHTSMHTYTHTCTYVHPMLNMCALTHTPICFPPPPHTHMHTHSPHLAEFPVVLILGLATSTATIHHHLPHAVTSLLSMEQFDTQHPFVTLPLVIKEVRHTHAFDLWHYSDAFLRPSHSSSSLPPSPLGLVIKRSPSCYRNSSNPISPFLISLVAFR